MSNTQVNITINLPKQGKAKTPLDDAISKIQDILSEVSKGETSYQTALEKISNTVKPVQTELEANPDLQSQLNQVLYALAYNALVVDEADPSQVKSLLPKQAWSMLQDDVSTIGRSLILNHVLEGETDKARELAEEYEDYLSDDDKRTVDMFLDEGFQELLSAVSTGDPDKTASAIKKLEDEGKYDEAKQVFNGIYNADLDELKQNAYRSVIYGKLESAGNPSEALDALKQSEDMAREAGMQDLISDLETSAKALNEAGDGNLEGFLGDASTIRDQGILKYTLIQGLNLLEEKHPEALAGLSDQTAGKLDSLLHKAGLSISVEGLTRIGEAVKVLDKINKALRESKPDEALDTWKGLDDELKAVVSALVGLKPEQLEETLGSLVKAEEYTREADKLAGMLNNGDYQGAYSYWSSLGDSDKKAVSSLLDTDLDELDHYIRLTAGLQAVSQLDNPTLAEVRDALAKYVGAEEAEKIAKRMLEESPAYQAKTLADRGEYDKALNTALGIKDEATRRTMVEYILASISDPASLADFISRHMDQLKQYLPEDVVRNIQLISNPDQVAGDIYSAIESEIADKYGGELKKTVDTYIDMLRNKEFDKAEEFLARNRDILSNARIDDTTLIGLLGELLTYSKAVVSLDELIDKLSAERNNPTGLQDIIQKAETYRKTLSGLKHLDNNLIQQITQAYKRLEAYAHLYLAQNHLSKGEYRKAEEEAHTASNLDPSLKQYSQTVDILVKAVEDKANLLANLECIMENVLQVKPQPRGNRARVTRRITYI